MSKNINNIKNIILFFFLVTLILLVHIQGFSQSDIILADLGNGFITSLFVINTEEYLQFC